jgi:hypothetical protein
MSQDINRRNGYRERTWDTRVGSVELKIPKLRQGSYVHGISTRSVDDQVKALGMSGVSKSQVSRLCAELDERVGAFLNRPIEDDWPYLWIDATYVKTRDAGRIVSEAVIVAVGVDTDGQREVLGLKVGASEAEPFRTEFLKSLNRRGLRGVKLVISDRADGYWPLLSGGARDLGRRRSSGTRTVPLDGQSSKRPGETVDSRVLDCAKVAPRRARQPVRRRIPCSLPNSSRRCDRFCPMTPHTPWMPGPCACRPRTRCGTSSRRLCSHHSISGLWDSRTRVDWA